MSNQEQANKDQNHTVWIVYNDTRKDFARAEKFGVLKDIFSGIGRGMYTSKILIDHARFVLSKAKPGDYLLVVGDPSLCAVCATVMAEELGGEITLLRWNRDILDYVPLPLDFEWSDE